MAERTLLVIPSIRWVTKEYLDPLLGVAADTGVSSVDLLIVDDADGNVSVISEGDPDKPLSVEDAVLLGWLPPSTRRFSRRDIEAFLVRAGLEPFLALIPQKNPSCKNFGLLYAWLYGYDRVFLLDDDCDARISPNFLSEVRLGWVSATQVMQAPSLWVNPMVALTEAGNLYSRGYPYEFRGEQMRVHTAPGSRLVVLNEGLWAGTPDINGIDKLQHATQTHRTNLIEDADRRLRTTDRYVVDRGHYLPLSIMNVQFLTQIVPCFWQPPDFTLTDGWKIRRHDDVWSAMVLARYLTDSDMHLSFGGPLIWHRKAGDSIKEALSEHQTNFAQQLLWEALLAAKTDTPQSIAEHLLTVGTGKTGGNVYYSVLRQYGQGLLQWAEGLGRIQFGSLRA